METNVKILILGAVRPGRLALAIKLLLAGPW
jgi:hypothetical protein